MAIIPIRARNFEHCAFMSETSLLTPASGRYGSGMQHSGFQRAVSNPDSLCGRPIRGRIDGLFAVGKFTYEVCKRFERLSTKTGPKILNSSATNRTVRNG